MDLTEINFELTEGTIRQRDEQTIRELFEFICHSVNAEPCDQAYELNADTHDLTYD